MRKIERGGQALDDVTHAVLAHALEVAAQLADDPAFPAHPLRLDIDRVLGGRLQLLQHQDRVAVLKQRPDLLGAGAGAR